MSRFTWDFKGTKSRRRERVNDKSQTWQFMSGNGIFAMSPQKWEFSGLNCVDALRWGAS